MSVSIILRTNKTKKDGTHPIAIQIIKDRRPSLLQIGHSIKLTDWDEEKRRVKKTHPNHARLNNLINKRLAEATDKALELETKGNVTSRAIKNKVRPKTGETFFAQADSYIASLKKNGKFNMYSTDGPRVEKFREFIGGDIAFSDISISLLESFVASLRAAGKLSERTIVNNLVVIRSVYAHARKAGVVDERYYPFGRGKIKIKFPDTSKVGLNPDEITALENVELNTRQDEVRNMFLFSLYTAGMRISDLMRLNWNDIQDGRMHYIMGKNRKGGSIKLPDKAVAILDKFRENDPPHNLVFRPLKTMKSLDQPGEVQKRIKSHIHDMNEQLGLAAKEAKIKKKVTFHIARHSFAQLAGDKIDSRTLQELFRHSSLQTTVGYMGNFITKKADDALDNVLNF